jgi:hypothetical protein
LKSFLRAVSGALLICGFWSVSATANAAQVDVTTSPSDKVVESLYFPKVALAFAKSELAIQRKYAQDFLDTEKRHSNSLTVVAGSNRFARDQVSSYSAISSYLPELKVTGSSDWGRKTSPRRFAPSSSLNPADHLVTIKPGNCRLSWSLFNSDTWFEPDCKVVVATPRQYLQAALIDYNQHATPESTSGYFIELESLKAISAGAREYTIKDGKIFSPDLDPMLAYTGLSLRFRSVDGSTGYDITIDPNNKYHFTFSVAPPVNQLRASWAWVKVKNGHRQLTFDRPLY